MKPTHLKKGDLQFSDKIKGVNIQVYYDDKATQTGFNEGSNIYAIFSGGNFIGFVPLGFSNYELELAVENWKKKGRKADYNQSLKSLKKE